MIIIRIESREVLDRLRALALAVGDPTAANRDVGRALLARVQSGFHLSRDPYGRAWKPLKYRVGKPLIDTGRLLASQTFLASRTEITVGTSVLYGKYHQFGTDRIPARSFLPTRAGGLPASWTQDVLAIYDQHILGASR